MRRNKLSERATALSLSILLALACGKKNDHVSTTTWQISADVLGHPLTMSSAPEFAGAFCSLVWNGKEFINHDDHGRELQSAASFDDLGECYNPTEAGSEADGAQDITTSQLRYFNVFGSEVTSATRMAFWLSANEQYPMGCGKDTAIKVAQNKTSVSDHILTKHITLGFAGIPNAIEYAVTYHVPEHHAAATFESLACYLQPGFSTFWTYDPSINMLTSLPAPDGEQSKPVIVSTSDSLYAIGVFSPDLPETSFPRSGYGARNFSAQQTTKCNTVFRRYDTPAGDYSFRSYLFVGTLIDVSKAMTLAYRKFHPTP